MYGSFPLGCQYANLSTKVTEEPSGGVPPFPTLVRETSLLLSTSKREDSILLLLHKQTLLFPLFLALFLIPILRLTFLYLGLSGLGWDEIDFFLVLGIFLSHCRLWLVSSRNLLK